MNNLLSLIVFTANILGSFNDPFEFEGDYGKEVNPIRKYVFEQVVSKEALANHLTDEQIKQLMKGSPTAEEIKEYRQQLITQALQQDKHHGPTFNELIPNTLVERLIEKQKTLNLEDFSVDELDNMLNFIKRYGDKRVFSFFRHSPPDLLCLDKILRDQASRRGKNFNLPILSSTEALSGENSYALKDNLLNALFTKDILHSTVKNINKLEESLEELDPAFLKIYFGEFANTNDLEIFTTPTGQVFFYWLYQSLNLHLIAQDQAMIAQINKAKKIFSETLGNPAARAQFFKDKLVAADASIVFTQESDTIISQLLTTDNLFHSIDRQNPGDGTFIFLRSELWNPAYQVIDVDDYEGYEKGRLNIILATLKETGQKFLLASAHGKSTRAEDGRIQMTKIVGKFNQLSRLPENNGLQLIIGTDVNTKAKEDTRLLRDHINTLGLIATDVGPTTVKKRMVTAQHAKAGRFAADEEDYVMILKPENGGLYHITHPTIGFKETRPDSTMPLPNINNPSDHYPVGVILKRGVN